MSRLRGMTAAGVATAVGIAAVLASPGPAALACSVCMADGGTREETAAVLLLLAAPYLVVAYVGAMLYAAYRKRKASRP